MEKFKEKLAELGVLEKFEANLERSNEVNGFDADSVIEYISTRPGNARKLRCAFKWGLTPEGFNFWAAMYDILNYFDEREANPE